MASMETDADLLTPAKTSAKKPEKPYRIPRKDASAETGNSNPAEAGNSNSTGQPKENQATPSHPWAKPKGKHFKKPNHYRKDWITAPKKGASLNLRFASEMARKGAMWKRAYEFSEDMERQFSSGMNRKRPS